MIRSAMDQFRAWLSACKTPVRPVQKIKRTRLNVEQLEDRLTPAAGLREQYMLELVNRMRENPAAELPILLNSGDPTVAAALSYFNVNRTTLQTQWNSLVAAPPLAWNDALALAARTHNQAMLSAGQQSHQVAGEASLGTRITNAGYTNWSSLGENIFAYADSIFSAHAAFAIDWGFTSTGIQSPPGHRQNIMSTSFREVGIGVLDAPSSSSVGPMLITQDFGNRFSFGNAYLLGTVFNDANSNTYYEPGEGLGSITLSITGSGGTTLVTTTAYGGYQLQLSAGTYSVTASGGGLSAPITKTVTVGANNVHVNFINGVQPVQPVDASLPYTDDFDAGPALPAEWTTRVGSFVSGNELLQAGTTPVNLAVLNGIHQANVVVQTDINLPATGVRSAGVVARYSGVGDKNMYLGSVTASNGVFTAILSRNVNGIWTTLKSVRVNTGAGTLRLEAVGTSLKLFLNSQLVAVAYDGTFASGSVGLRGTASASFASFAADGITLTDASLAFSDSFTSLSIGGQLNGYWLSRAGSFVGNGAGTMTSSSTGIHLATVNGIGQANVAVQADISLTSTGVRSAGLVARYAGTGDRNMYLANLSVSNGVFTAVISRNVNGTWTTLSSARVSTGSGTLRFEVVGSSLKLFLNGRLAVVAYDTLLTSGTIGLRASNVASFANFSAAALTLANASLDFSDDFTSLAPAGQLDSHWLSRAGSFTGNGAGTLTSGATGVHVATVNGINQANVAVQADIDLARTGIHSAGLVARYSGAGDRNMYQGAVTGSNGVFTAYIYRNVNGVWTVLGSARVASGTGTLRFEAVGTSLKLFFNGKLVVFAYDATFSSGTIGLRALSSANFANFQAGAITTLNQSLGFSDDFSAPTASAESVGTQLSRAWQEKAGSFSGDGSDQMASARGKVNLAIVNGISAANVSVQANVNVTLNGADAGLVTRYSGPGDRNMYLGTIKKVNGVYSAQIYRNYNGVWTLLRSVRVSTGAGLLRFESIGTTHNLYWNGVLVASAIDSLLTTGGVGMRLNQQAIIDDFSVS